MVLLLPLPRPTDVKRVPAVVERGVGYEPRSVQEQPLSRNVDWFRGGLVFNAHRFLIHSTLGSRVEKRSRSMKRSLGMAARAVCRWLGSGVRIHPKFARMSGRHGVQYMAHCVACATLMLLVWQQITNFSAGGSVGHHLSMGVTEDLR